MLILFRNLPGVTTSSPNCPAAGPKCRTLWVMIAFDRPFTSYLMGSGFRARPVRGNGIRPVRVDQGPVFPCHQRSGPADEIPHLSAKSTVRPPASSDGSGPKDRFGKLALGGASGEAVEHLERPRVEQIGSAGPVYQPLPPIRRGRVERMEGGHGTQGCALCSAGWNLIGKPIASAKTIREVQLRALRTGSDHELEIRSVAEQALTAREVPDRELIPGRSLSFH